MSGDRAEKSREYWAAREKENAKRLSDRKDGYRKEIAAEYEYTRQQIEDRINAFYERYADSEGITMAEARKRVSKIDMETYERKAAKYVQEKNFSRRANEEMKLYNATMKINRLELLKAEIGLELTAEADALDKSTGDILQTETFAEYRRLAGILGMTVGSTAEEARSVAESSFKGATYSDRIWSHQEALKAEIDKKLSEAMISGRSSRDLAADLRRRFAVSQSNAERLIDTEIRRCQTGAAKAVYEKNGTDEYEFMAIGPHPCDICKPMDGKKFKVADMKPGENAPPMHPRCHCTTGPVTSDNYTSVGELKDVKSIESEYGKLATHDVIITNERAQHINERHPEVAEELIQNLKSIIADPDEIYKDTDHSKTICLLKEVDSENHNVIIKLVTVPDTNRKNSVITYYRMNDKSKKRFEKRHPCIYKKGKTS